MTDPEPCRELWHVFDFRGDLSSMTCHCGERTIAVVLKQLTPADVPVAG